MNSALRLVEAINKLKYLLSEEGDYSIVRSDGKPMELSEGFAVFAVLEGISKAIKEVEEENK